MASGCPICDGSATAPLGSLHDDRYGFIGEFSLTACRGCEHRWLDWRPDAGVLERLYSDYYPRSAKSVDELVPLRSSGRWSGWWRGESASAARWVPERVSVLDIGCGFGEALAYHRDRGCEVRGVEADRNIARVAEAFGFDVHVGLFDATNYAPASFDYVTMDQVIEHMTDPVATLAGVRTVLRPDGALVLATPNAAGVGARLFGKRWLNWHAPYHLHFFSRASLRITAERAGMRIARLDTVTSSEWLRYQWIHLALRAAPGEKSVWSDRAKTTSERMTIGVIAALHRLGGNHLVTRIWDGLGRGDNFLVELVRA